MESENSGILLETRGIKKRFGGNVVLDGIDLKINKNEIAFVCEECCLSYKDKKLAEKCEAWCKEKGGLSPFLLRPAHKG